MKKQTIKNRRNQNLSLLIHEAENHKGIALLMHGMGLTKEEQTITTASQTLHQLGYTTIRFDTANGAGESDGLYENITVTGNYQDLEDVIKYTKDAFPQENKYTLVGHSLGGLCALTFAQNTPEQVKDLILISTIISFEHSMKNYPKEMIDLCKEKGFYTWEENGIEKKLKWSFIEDGLKYDTMKKAKEVRTPTLMIVGDSDSECPLKDQKALYNAIPATKHMHIIKGASHLITDDKHANELKEAIEHWMLIKK